MKKVLHAISILSLSILFSCDELDKLTQFRMNYTESVTVQSYSVIGLPFDLSTPTIPSNSESTFSGNNTSANLIEEISLEAMTLSISSPSSGSFDFLESASLLISADGLDEIEIAYLEEVPEDGSSSLEMEVTGVNVKEYILADEFQIRMKSETDKTISEDYEIEIRSVFFVDAKILGQ